MTVENIATSLNRPFGVAYHPGTDTLFFRDEDALAIYSVPASGGTPTSIVSLTYNNGDAYLGVDTENDKLYFVEYSGSGQTWYLFSCDLDGSNLTNIATVATDATTTSGIRVEGDYVYVMMYRLSFDSTIYRLDLDGSNLTALHATATLREGIAIDSTNGHIYSWNQGARELSRVDLADGANYTTGWAYDLPGFLGSPEGSVNGIGFDPVNEKIYVGYVASFNSIDAIRENDPADSGWATTVDAGVDDVQDLVFQDGSLYFSAEGATGGDGDDVVAKFFVYTPPVSATLTPTEVGKVGGTVITVNTTLPAGVTEFEIFVGPTGDATDSPAYSGIQGQGNTIKPDSGLLKAYTPPLDAGLYSVTVTRKDTGAVVVTITDGLTYLPNQISGKLGALRRSLSPKFDVKAIL